MPDAGRRRLLRALPLTLALAMLAVVVLAGLLPDTGVVGASSNCTYGKCPAASPFPIWTVSAAAVIVVLALLVALLLLRRSRRPPPATPVTQPEIQEAGTASGETGTENPPYPSETWDEAPASPGPYEGSENATQGPDQLQGG